MVGFWRVRQKRANEYENDVEYEKGWLMSVWCGLFSPVELSLLLLWLLMMRDADVDGNVDAVVVVCCVVL